MVGEPGDKLNRDDPGKPYQNGGHERMHRDMMVELEGQIDGNLNEHQRVFDIWRESVTASGRMRGWG
jgi:hypothetical protein